MNHKIESRQNKKTPDKIQPMTSPDEGIKGYFKIRFDGTFITFDREFT